MKALARIREAESLHVGIHHQTGILLSYNLDSPADSPQDYGIIISFRSRSLIHYKLSKVNFTERPGIEFITPCTS